MNKINGLQNELKICKESLQWFKGILAKKKKELKLNKKYEESLVQIQKPIDDF